MSGHSGHTLLGLWRQLGFIQFEEGICFQLHGVFHQLAIHLRWLFNFFTGNFYPHATKLLVRLPNTGITTNRIVVIDRTTRIGFLVFDGIAARFFIHLYICPNTMWGTGEEFLYITGQRDLFSLFFTVGAFFTPFIIQTALHTHLLAFDITTDPTTDAIIISFLKNGITAICSRTHHALIG